MQTNAKETSGTQSFNLGEFQVNSNVEISRDELGLIHGDEIQVKNNGQVLYEHLRGFLPLNDKTNLVRFADGVWALVYINKSKQVKLKNVNLHHAGIYLFFDERGKIHPNQESPHCRKIEIEA